MTVHQRTNFSIDMIFKCAVRVGFKLFFEITSMYVYLPYRTLAVHTPSGVVHIFRKNKKGVEC